MLGLYAPPEDATWARQVQGVQGLQARPVVRRLPFDGPLSFGSGVEITLELDELAFQGGSAFLLASVLERFFARHAAVNSFTQFTLRTPQRGEVVRWPPRIRPAGRRWRSATRPPFAPAGFAGCGLRVRRR